MAEANLLYRNIQTMIINILKMNHQIILIIKILLKKYFPLDIFIYYYYDFLILIYLMKIILKRFFFKLCFFIFIFFPIITLFKVLFYYFIKNNMDIILFIQEYISYTPFLGKYLITYFSPDKIFISSDIFIRNQHTSELMMIGE